MLVVKVCALGRDLRDGLFVHTLIKEVGAVAQTGDSTVPTINRLRVRTASHHDLYRCASCDDVEVERDRYKPMPSRGVQFIKWGSDRNPCPIVPAQFFPRLAVFFFCLFVSHKGWPR